MTGGELRVEGLDVAPGPRAAFAVRGATFALPEGRTLALLGASGAGKTTLLRALAGLVTPRAGVVRLGGTVLDGPGVHVPPEHRGVGLVFQALELWPHMGAGEHVAFALRAAGTGRGRRAEVAAWFDAVGLDPALARRRPAALSGGEAQRLAIARTLAAEPRLVLYDEPLSHLDPERRRALRALLRQLARERGHTAVLVSHDPEDALELADRVAVLDHGVLVEGGVPSEVRAAPRTEAGARAFGPVTLLDATWRGTALDTVLGPLEPRAGSGATDGRPARLALRPEAVRARAPGEGAAGIVVDRFATPAGHHVVVDVAGVRIEAQAELDVAVGAPVSVVVVEPVVPLDPGATPRTEAA